MGGVDALGRLGATSPQRALAPGRAGRALGGSAAVSAQTLLLALWD